VSAEGARETGPGLPEQTSPRVLVVDDYSDNRELMCELLQTLGLRVLDARSGPEAIDRARTFRPHVVLMDLALPGVDGWEATRQLLSDPRTHRARIIAVTAHAEQEALDRAREAGCVATVIKPFDADELLAEVRRQIVDVLADPAD
jgi:two-component system cell cycle response regulator DivK